MKPRAFKRIWGHSWDWGYLIKLEYFKLKEMANTFEKASIVEGSEFVVRDIKLCLKLIDIILERDSKRYKNGKNNTYINIRNCERFCNKWESIIIRKRSNNPILLDSLRINKAFYLYNKIRAYKMRLWWF